MKFSKRSKITVGVVAAVAACAWFGITEYRIHVACAARNGVLQRRVQKLRDDAHDQLRVGVNKAQIVRFFEQQQMQATFGYGVASGDFRTTGCAPFGCGADTVVVGVSVAVDSQGTVVGEPHVADIYTDCL